MRPVKDIRQVTRLKKFWADERDVVGLYAGVLFQGFTWGIWLVAIPFVIKRLGGSDFDVGLCMGMGFAGYMMALAASLLGWIVLEKFKIKRVVQCGTGVITMVPILAYLTVSAAEKGYFSDYAILILTSLATIQGLSAVMFWPRVMSWLSLGHEGRELNRRLGIFNVFWSFSGMIGPYIGGYLVEVNSTLPIVICILMSGASFVGVSFAGKPAKGQEPAANSDDAKNGDGMELLLRQRFMWMSRVGLLTSFICIGLARTPLALLFKYNLGFSESNYGTAIMIMSAAVFVVFFAAARTHKWHYLVSIFLGTQVMLLFSMLLILKGVSLWVLFSAVILVGGGQAFLYASHLYYGISGAQDRQRRTMIHEMTLCLGMVIGSLVGGYLSDNVGPYAPYWFGFCAVAGGLVVQFVIWNFHRLAGKG
ncbi:MAG: MFS transporter [Planctomycetota bacterium]|jgi:MFS family permease